MKNIKAVLHDINKSELGWCQCHEHIFLADGPSRKLNSALCMTDYEKSKSEVFSYKKAGGNSFIDCQPGYFGRMAENLARVSSETGVNIIAVTGFHKLEFCEDLSNLKNSSAKQLADHFADEIKIGMVENNIRLKNKAGVIKCAQVSGDDWKNDIYKKLFEAVAIAALKTDTPIIVHLDSGADAIGLIDYFKGMGIDSQKLILCHLDRANQDFDYHVKVASTGAYLQYDTINRLKYHSNKKEIELIKYMISAGYERQLLLGMDTTNQRLLAYGADFGLNYILTDFKFNMIKHGIDENIVNKIMTTNAASALAF